jgi:pimeloyl-ACP methyl ester carboxylesterase
MKIIRHPGPSGDGERILLVMLPGVGIEPEDFARHGLVKAMRDRMLPVDIIAAGPDTDLYLDGTIVEAIHETIVVPALAGGPVRLWYLGLSLGGMGALLYARKHGRAVEGVLLLAPFLGTPGMVAEVARAGGLATWEPGDIRPNDGERKLLTWLKDKTAAPPAPPTLYLGYGRGDRFAPGHAMLAAHLPAPRVFVTDGGHDWATWTKLWQQILDADPFATQTARHA